MVTEKPRNNRPHWVLRMDEQVGIGPEAPTWTDDDRDIAVQLFDDPLLGPVIFLDDVDGMPLTPADARRIAASLNDLADIADPDNSKTQALRALIEDSRYGFAEPDELHAALTAAEQELGVRNTSADVDAALAASAGQ